MKAKVATRVIETVMAVVLLTGCSTTESFLAVGNVSHSGCKDTRGVSVAYNPTLKLTREGNNINGELYYFHVNCDHNDVEVNCQQDGTLLNISVSNPVPRRSKRNNDIQSLCDCHVNVYFTAYDVEGDTYTISLNGRNLGNVSFKNHNVVEIDLVTLEQANEEGFEYQEIFRGMDGFSSHPYVSGTDDPSVRIFFFYEPFLGMRSQFIKIMYDDYNLPCDYTKFDVVLDKENDSTLVFRFDTDGTYGKNCDQMADFSFSLDNAVKDKYYLKVNPHTVIVKEEDGTEHEETVCDFDGVVSKNGKYEYYINLSYTEELRYFNVYSIGQNSQEKPHLRIDFIQGNSFERPYIDIKGICVLPCDYKQFEMVMDKEDDNTLVFRIVTDGKYSFWCNKLGRFEFQVWDAVKDSYHIKFNPHTVIVKDKDGTKHEETVYDFDGVVSKNGNSPYYYIDLR